MKTRLALAVLSLAIVALIVGLAPKPACWVAKRLLHQRSIIVVIEDRR